jgi:hypothetical protein
MMLQNGARRGISEESGSFLQERSWFGTSLSPYFYSPVKPTTTTINLTT